MKLSEAPRKVCSSEDPVSPRPFQRPSGRGCDRGAAGRALPVSCCVLPDKVPERQEEEAQGDIQG